MQINNINLTVNGHSVLIERTFGECDIRTTVRGSVSSWRTDIPTSDIALSVAAQCRLVGQGRRDAAYKIASCIRLIRDEVLP